MRSGKGLDLTKDRGLGTLVEWDSWACHVHWVINVVVLTVAQMSEASKSRLLGLPGAFVALGMRAVQNQTMRCSRRPSARYFAPINTFGSLSSATPPHLSVDFLAMFGKVFSNDHAYKIR